MKFSSSATLATGLLVVAFPVLAETLIGRVVGIADGDTLTVLDGDYRQHKIRLLGIDAPEKRQACGHRSAQSLATLAFQKEVTAECRKADRYGRAVCKILVERRDANLAQIEAGMAWWYRAYAREQTSADQAAYEAAEARARVAHRGLWADVNAHPPWEWRRTAQSRRVRTE